MNKKYLQICVWLVAMALALGVAARYWRQAFPVAAVPFPLTRGEVQKRMDSFLTGMGAPIEGYRSVVRFGESTETKNFIERQYGPARLTKAAGDGVNIWYWVGRWFKPEQHEEYWAWTDQEGNIVGYSHIIEEERALLSLTEAQARAMAEDFLRRNIPRHPMAALHYLEASSEKKPHRTDFTFTWEQEALRMGDAPYHLNVTVQGNEIGSYGEDLKVPEWWTVQYERQRAVNDLCYSVAYCVLIGIVAALMIALVAGIWHHRVRWRDAVPWGWLAVFAVVGAAMQINSIPDTISGYATTEKWEPFVVGAIFNGVRSVLGGVLGVWLLMLVADCIYRERLPGKSSFRRALGRQALRDRETVRAMGVGIAFATFSLGYVCMFYAAGQRLGVWCPVDIDYSKTMSGPMPWVEAMQTGLTACFTEEMIFRVGALLLLWRILRVRWLAVLLSAAAWGFMHSNYPQMPGYTRGIELTIVGVVWGMLLLRYGVMATLTAHYLYDCWLGSLITFQSASWENKAGAIAVSVWPVALFLWGTLKRGAVLEPEETHITVKAHLPPPPPREWAHVPLTMGRSGRALVLAGCAAGLAAVFLLPRPDHKIAELGKLDLSRSEILEKADAVVKKHGYSPEGYHRVTSLYPQGAPSAYLLEHGSLDGLAGLYNKEWPDLFWYVRYFQFLQPEQFTVKLDQHGRELAWYHTVLREAPGGSLDEATALAQARGVMERDGRIDLSRQQLVQEGPTQQEHRRDWMFAFDQKDFGWGEAKLRTYIWLQGNEVVGLTRQVKVPDAWILEHAKRGWKQLISGELKHWAGLAESVILGVLLIITIQKHLTPWRKAFLYGLFPAGLWMVDQLNQAQQFYSGYATTTPRAHYLITQLGTRAEGLLMVYLVAVFMIGVALGFLHWAWGWTPEQLVVWPADRRERGLFWTDTLLAAFASMVAFWLLGLADVEVLGRFWPAEMATIRYWNVEEWAPWIGAVTKALLYVFGEMIRLAIIASVLRLIWGRYPRLAWAVFILLPLLRLGTYETMGGFIWGLVYAEAAQLLTAWLVLKVWRFNLVAILLTYTMASLWTSVSLFLHKGGPVYRWEAAPLIGVMVVALAMGWWGHRRERWAAP